MGRIRLFGPGRAALVALPALAMLALLARPANAQSGTNYRSIGTDGTVLHSGLAEATIAVGTSTIDFLTANLPLDKIGVGDRITLDPSGTPDVYYILSVENRARVTIHGTATMSHATVDYQITRAYTSLGAWESARDGDLVGEARHEVGVAYNDGPFSSLVDIDATSSSASFFMELTVALGHRHDGTAGTGVVLDGLSSNDGIHVNESFTRIKWFELRNHDGAATSAIQLAAASVVFDSLLIHDAAFAIKAEPGSSFTLRNSILYDSEEAVHDENTTATIENCTIYNIALTDGAVKEDGGTFTVTNTISMDNGGRDFKDISVQVNNMSSDLSALPLANRSKSSAI